MAILAILSSLGAHMAILAILAIWAPRGSQEPYPGANPATGEPIWANMAILSSQMAKYGVLGAQKASQMARMALFGRGLQEGPGQGWPRGAQMAILAILSTWAQRGSGPSVKPLPNGPFQGPWEAF